MFNAEKGLVLSITGSENWLKATAFLTASLSYDVLHSDCTISDFKTFFEIWQVFARPAD